MFKTTNMIKSERVKQGFTLIELLVTISIIAVLAAILFPVFARARENARRTTCLSNMKQLALGLVMYTQDHDERLPNYLLGDWWPVKIEPYVKSRQLFRCPNVSKQSGQAADWGNNFYSTYALNGVGSSTGLYISSGRTLATIDSPAVTWMLHESGHPHYYYTHGYGFSYSNIANGSRTRPEDDTYWLTYHDSFAEYNGRAPHLEGSNIAYADGHVKWRKNFADLTGENWRALANFVP